MKKTSRSKRISSSAKRVRPLRGVKRIVVKVGSGVIAARGKLRPKAVGALAADVTAIREAGNDVVMVVSGAVAAGFAALELDTPPTGVVERQAAASIGQYRLMGTLARAFHKHGANVAQLLMMSEDIDNRRRFISARHTMYRLLAHGIVPIINENDPLADDEAKIGDNDHLAALVTSVISADLLVILSSVAGVYRNGSGEVIPQVDIGSSIDEHITSAMSEAGVGGMRAKVSAARLASQWGVPTIIASGGQPGLLPRIIAGEPHGTMFVPGPEKLSSRKRWIAVRTKSRGCVHVDDGARKAVVERGASLLPAGITAVEGRFQMGDRIDVRDGAGTLFAVGLSSYSSEEVRRMQGKRRTEFKNILGYEYVDEIIDRDDLVLVSEREAKGLAS